MSIYNKDNNLKKYYTLFCLSSDEKLDIFDKTFIFKDNQFGVEDIDDTAAYLIMKNCENGYCKFKELDKLMARYGVKTQVSGNWKENITERTESSTKKEFTFCEFFF